MSNSIINIPESVWLLADRARLKSQLEKDLRAGNLKTVLRRIKEEGVEIAAEMNKTRLPDTPPYAFEASLPARRKSGNENESWFCTLQELYSAVTKIAYESLETLGENRR